MSACWPEELRAIGAIRFGHQCLYRAPEGTLESAHAALLGMGAQLFLREHFKLRIEERVQALRAADVDPDVGALRVFPVLLVLGQGAGSMRGFPQRPATR